MKTRRTKRKMARRKKVSPVRAVVVREKAPINYRIALPPGQRRLSFGDRWAYAPAPEANNYITLKPRYQLFIGGKFVAPRSGMSILPSSPRDGPTTMSGAKCPDASAENIFTGSRA
jgi:hypothetical protein